MTKDHRDVPFHDCHERSQMHNVLCHENLPRHEVDVLFSDTKIMIDIILLTIYNINYHYSKSSYCTTFLHQFV